MVLDGKEREPGERADSPKVSMVKILREADTESVPEAAKRHAVSEQTIYAWRKRYGELEVSDVRRLRELEQENARLKRLVAERDLEIDVMREIAQKKW